MTVFLLALVRAGRGAAARGEPAQAEGPADQPPQRSLEGASGAGGCMVAELQRLCKPVTSSPHAPITRHALVTLEAEEISRTSTIR